MARPKSRPQRWADACSAALTAFTELETAMGKVESAVEDLKSIQEEYNEWKGNLPDSLQSSSVGEKLDAIENLGLDDLYSSLESAVEEAKGVIEEAEGLDLPRGFGKD